MLARTPEPLPPRAARAAATLGWAPSSTPLVRTEPSGPTTTSGSRASSCARTEPSRAASAADKPPTANSRCHVRALVKELNHKCMAEWMQVRIEFKEDLSVFHVYLT